MRRNSVTTFILAASVAVASVAAFVPLGAVHAEPLQSAEVAALIGKQGFEFRGRYTMWKFGPDGRVTADDSRIPALALGGSSEQFGLKNTGTWRVQGQQLCIKWNDAQSDQCYTVSRGTGRMVVLNGPRQLEGTIDAREETGFAETPQLSRPSTISRGSRYYYAPAQ